MKPKISLIAVLVLLDGLHQVAASSADQQIAAANNGFAFKLLKQLAKEPPAANIFISPYSASTVLQMVGNGLPGGRRRRCSRFWERRVCRPPL